jgi:ankyrin repeat protein
MNGRSLLHYAADAGNFDVLKELVNNGANVNVNLLCLFFVYI